MPLCNGAQLSYTWLFTFFHIKIHFGVIFQELRPRFGDSEQTDNAHLTSCASDSTRIMFPCMCTMAVGWEWLGSCQVRNDEVAEWCFSFSLSVDTTIHRRRYFSSGPLNSCFWEFYSRILCQRSSAQMNVREATETDSSHMLMACDDSRLIKREDVRSGCTKIYL